jgi:hypothetical protein
LDNKAGETARLRFAAAAFARLQFACTTAQAQFPPVRVPPAATASIDWNSTLGRGIYDSEGGGAGVFAYPVPFGDNVGYVDISGLAVEFGGSVPLDSYW